MRSTTLLRPAFSVVLLGLVATHGARAADAPATTVRLVPDDYATIQAAVDAALPGDTVRVGPGVWYESVSVTLDDPTDALTIDAADAVVVGGDGPALAVTGPGTFRLVRGILRSETTALAASGTDTGTLTFSMDGSTVHGVEHAISLRYASVNMYVLDASALVSDAIVVAASPGAYITGNVSFAGASGVVAERVDSLNLESLRVQNCGENGIVFVGGELLMRSCEVRDVGRTGVDLRIEKSCVVEQNTVTAATYRGISLSWRPRSTVIVGHNAVTGGVFGIVARGGDGTIRDSTVTGAILDGITWRGNLSHRRVEGRPVGLVSNTITGSGRSAIRVEGIGHRLIANTINRGGAGSAALSGLGRIAASRGNTVDGRELKTR
jgi:hypothetical protein